MKALSGSIVILAAAVMITGGAFVRHGDSSLFVQCVGCLLGAAGIYFWASAMREESTRGE